MFLDHQIKKVLYIYTRSCYILAPKQLTRHCLCLYIGKKNPTLSIFYFLHISCKTMI